MEKVETEDIGERIIIMIKSWRKTRGIEIGIDNVNGDLLRVEVGLASGSARKGCFRLGGVCIIDDRKDR